MKKLLKFIYSYFLTIYVFESFAFHKKVKKIKLSMFLIKSVNKAKKNKIVKKYFTENKFKLLRFKKKSQFIGFSNKTGIVCSGWINQGSLWRVEEIKKNISLNNKYLLYDFFTEEKFRNKGYYKLLLCTIQKKFKNKKFLIYSLSHNNKSISAIKKSGFKLVKKIRK